MRAFACVASLSLLASPLMAESAEAKKEWCDYAAPRVEQLARGDWATGLPLVLLRLIHPTATSPVVESVSAQCDRGRFGVDAVVTLRWRGGLLGREFRTTVSWSLDDKTSSASVSNERGAPTSPPSADLDVTAFLNMLLPGVALAIPSNVPLPSKRPSP